jgi:hypothetical protein
MSANDNRIAPATRAILDVIARQYSAIGAEIRSIDKSKIMQAHVFAESCFD